MLRLLRDDGQASRVERPGSVAHAATAPARLRRPTRQGPRNPGAGVI